MHFGPQRVELLFFGRELVPHRLRVHQRLNVVQLGGVGIADEGSQRVVGRAFIGHRHHLLGVLDGVGAVLQFAGFGGFGIMRFVGPRRGRLVPQQGQSVFDAAVSVLLFVHFGHGL